MDLQKRGEEINTRREMERGVAICDRRSSSRKKPPRSTVYSLFLISRAINVVFCRPSFFLFHSLTPAAQMPRIIFGIAIAKKKKKKTTKFNRGETRTNFCRSYFAVGGSGWKMPHGNRPSWRGLDPAVLGWVLRLHLGRFQPQALFLHYGRTRFERAHATLLPK